MAGGMEWFRWHHGSVTDPKFKLIARRAGAPLPDVLAVWAYLLEAASAAADRGHFGAIDCEAVDCLFDFPAATTRTKDILAAMEDRGLITDRGCVVAWEKRQPKREDETAADRKRRQREREQDMALAKTSVTDSASRNVTQGHANLSSGHADVTPGHDRGEERREEPNTGQLPLAPAFQDEKLPASLSTVSRNRHQIPDCPHMEILGLWEQVLPGMPQHNPSNWDGARQEHLRARWRKAATDGLWTTKQEGLDYFRKLFAYVGKSKFLTGETESKPGKRPFMVELEWLINPNNWNKVLDGKFHDEVSP